MCCESCIYCNTYGEIQKMCYFYASSLMFYSPIFSSFLYVFLLIFPWLMEIIIVHQQSVKFTVNTILFCSAVQTGLSVHGAVTMGYNFFCCCKDRRISIIGEMNKMVDDSADRVWCASPMKLSSLLSPGYIIYFGVPWLLTNIFVTLRLSVNNNTCLPPALYLLIFMPLLVYFPCFAVGSAYRNIIETAKLNKNNVIKDNTGLKEIDDTIKTLPKQEKSEKSNKDEPKDEVNNNQQLYKDKPLTLKDVRGESSKSIFRYMTDIIIHGYYYQYPIDVDDYERNRALLICYPEWRKRISGMNSISKQWNVLSNNWSEIERLYEKDYLIYHGLNMEGECNKFIHKLLKDG